MRLSIMQPYFFPYLGYFQLVRAADRFIFYDDVNYITGGWINRNRILIHGSAAYITIPCRNVSQNKLIYEIHHALNDKSREKLARKVKMAYSNAPYFQNVFSLIREVIYSGAATISELAIASVSNTLGYLEIDTPLKRSSLAYRNQHLKGAGRILDICKKEDASAYINAIGGKELYSKEAFLDEGIELKFLNSTLQSYDQFGIAFVPGLSIIDVMMFNSIPEIQKMLAKYTLE